MRIRQRIGSATGTATRVDSSHSTLLPTPKSPTPNQASIAFEEAECDNTLIADAAREAIAALK